MTNKKTRGLTLVELLISVALLALVTVCAGTALFSAFQSYAVTAKLQEDEYNARLALLSMTREAHRGVTGVFISKGTNDTLELTMPDGAIVKFYLTDGTLYRDVSGGDTPVAFTTTRLNSFEADVTADGRWLTLRVEGQHDLVLETTISLSRIPAG